MFAISVRCSETEQWIHIKQWGFFFLKVFYTYSGNKLLAYSDTDNPVPGEVHFSQYHYHMQLLKSFKKKDQNQLIEEASVQDGTLQV